MSFGPFAAFRKRSLGRQHSDADEVHADAGHATMNLVTALGCAAKKLFPGTYNTEFDLEVIAPQGDDHVTVEVDLVCAAAELLSAGKARAAIVGIVEQMVGLVEKKDGAPGANKAIELYNDLMSYLLPATQCIREVGVAAMLHVRHPSESVREILKSSAEYLEKDARDNILKACEAMQDIVGGVKGSLKNLFQSEGVTKIAGSVGKELSREVLALLSSKDVQEFHTAFKGVLSLREQLVAHNLLMRVEHGSCTLVSPEALNVTTSLVEKDLSVEDQELKDMGAVLADVTIAQALFRELTCVFYWYLMITDDGNVRPAGLSHDKATRTIVCSSLERQRTLPSSIARSRRVKSDHNGP